ncbi:MAG TPA: clostripain-related cysteine peptidase [Gemmatimonadales bacterium]|nr:clostripain-related cysteine peptidase [Gemmatimonadales bacterium]
MKALRLAALVGALGLAGACGGGGSDEGGGGGGGGGGGTREWTVMVYMAADNSLAVQGVLDLDEMEDAGISDKIQTVVQAEFSPTVLAQYNCGAACFNRPSFNTFRYAIDQAGGSAKNGPDRGTVSEINGGTNVDMTNPQTLKDFVAWAKANYPANHYLLVLWNHGGGYTGLIQDETSGGSGLMSLDGVKTALTGSGGIDVIDFDMCLMAGYETLAKIEGLANFAVFSEEVVPGEGNPYTSILDGMQASPTQDGRALASMIVDRFNASFQGNKASTTLSAYDMAGFTAFETALNDLAGSLQTGLAGGLGPTIASASAASQKYTITELTDLVNFLDTLNAKVTGQAALQAKIAAVKTAATAAAFRINNRARTGNGETQGGGVADVSRSTGLNIVLPSGANGDVMPGSGAGSLNSYAALLPGKAWTAFLNQYAGGQATTDMKDQGNNRLETYLVWESGAVAAGADVDLWVLEPDGNIYLPAFGSVTPNGTMSNDSWNDQVNFEGYLTNRYIEKGDYYFFANLWRDPANFQPAYDLAYRFDQTTDFSWYFQGNGQQPRVLSLQTSWLDDPTPTLNEVASGAYTDLQLVTSATIAAPPAPTLRANPAPGAMTASFRQSAARVTPAQLATVRRLATMERLGMEARAPRFAGLWHHPFPAR